MKSSITAAMVVTLTLIASVFFGQDKGHTDRDPAVAGRFYSAGKAQLETEVDELFLEAVPRQHENVIALISPHAGYVFSGEVSASSFNQIPENAKYERVFILASSHQLAFDGASIYDRGDYRMPMGNVRVDKELAAQLIEEHDFFTFRRDAHLNEHSLEVQLPFLQRKLGDNLTIVPIVLGTQDPKTCRKMAEALKPYLGGNNLFVISTDFSHYPGYEDAVRVDGESAAAIISNDPEQFLQIREDHAREGVQKLATSACGWTSVLTLMYMTEKMHEVSYHPIQYLNSGDNPIYGDKDRVVGYHAIAVTRDSEDRSVAYTLSAEDQETLLRIARTTVETYVKSGKTPELNKKDFSGELLEHNGAFVTLHKEGKLRGCIGRFQPEIPLFEVVQKMAVSAATQDYRFQKVTEDELPLLEYEISVLSPLRKVDQIEEIELGRHGIYIKKGYQSGTYLPQVATQTGWTLEEFLGHCARDKARIGWDGWKDAEIFIYEAFVFDEKGRH